MSTLPQASGTFGEKPVLSFPENSAPEELTVEVLEQGTGDEVRAGQNIDVHYLGQVWGGGIFDNSYDRRSSIQFPIGVGAVISGWDESLV